MDTSLRVITSGRRRPLRAHGVLPHGDRYAEHFAVEKAQRGERLVRRGCADLPLHRQHGEERRHLAVTNLPRVRRRDMAEIPLRPAQVCLLSARAQVPQRARARNASRSRTVRH